MKTEVRNQVQKGISKLDKKQKYSKKASKGKTMTIKLQANDWKLKVSVQKEIPERISSLLFQWSNPLFAAYQSKKLLSLFIVGVSSSAWSSAELNPNFVSKSLQIAE